MSRATDAGSSYHPDSRGSTCLYLGRTDTKLIASLLEKYTIVHGKREECLRSPLNTVVVRRLFTRRFRRLRTFGRQGHDGRGPRITRLQDACFSEMVIRCHHVSLARCSCDCHCYCMGPRLTFHVIMNEMNTTTAPKRSMHLPSNGRRGSTPRISFIRRVLFLRKDACA